MTITDAQWKAARETLRAAGDRFTRLVRTSEPRAMATADWSVADTAAHVAVIALMNTKLVTSEPFPFPKAHEIFETARVETVADFNDVTLREFTERDVPTLAGRLTEDIDRILSSTADHDPDEPLPWLGGARIPVAGVFAHLTNELLIHGRDVARATGVRWEIDPADAAQFFEIFLVGVTRYGSGHLLDTDRPISDRRVAVEFRSRYTTPVTMVLDRGQVSLAAPRPDDDVRLFYDPATLALMLFGRVSRARAALTGKVVVWGRRPWLLPIFLKKMRLPS
ncbi:maleylpyruvate isomerase family mycothiol-dependent enzyme [Actinoallomurus sp. NPDC050550]|uniref:maleylpyruvate isomerase family mycothiol-dependent enzyme n=1 Tax=Actinoallomurus sp. NPDC050550 TaxID=3154937 RepID=UPI00340E2C63